MFFIKSPEKMPSRKLLCNDLLFFFIRTGLSKNHDTSYTTDFQDTNHTDNHPLMRFSQALPCGVCLRFGDGGYRLHRKTEMQKPKGEEAGGGGVQCIFFTLIALSAILLLSQRSTSQDRGATASVGGSRGQQLKEESCRSAHRGQ